MQTISESHPQSAWLFACSKTIERVAYYGFRGLVVLFMVDILGMPNTDALTIYGWFAGTIILSHLLGGIIGDLIIGNRAASLAGGVLLAIGTFILCTLSLYGLYIGLVLIIIGDSLYYPSIAAQFGKCYLSKFRLLDAAFTLFYVGINIGAGLGVFLIASIGGDAYWPGFLTAGVLHLLAVGILALIPLAESEAPTASEQQATPPPQPAYKTDLAPLFILGALMIVAIFWGIYEFSGNATHTLYMNLADNSAISAINIGWSYSLNSISTIIIGAISVGIWSAFYANRMLKLSIGFLAAGVSFVILFTLPESPTDAHLPLVGLAIFLLAFAEMYISPLIYATLTEYGNPDLLATLIGLSTFCTRMVTFLFGLYILDLFYDMTTITFGISAGVLGGIGILLGVLFLANLKPDAIKEI